MAVDILLFLSLTLLTIAAYYQMKASLVLLPLVAIFALAAERIEFPGLASLIVLGGVAFSLGRLNISPWLKYLGHSVVILLVLALSLHLIPGFQNWQILKDVAIAEDSIPYSLYLNLDQQLAAMALLLVVPIHRSWETLKVASRQSLIFFAPIFGFVAILSLVVGYVRWDPKLVDFLPIWALKNLLFTCFSEELFFRGYLQTNFVRFFKDRIPYGTYLGIFFAALLFGIAHFGGGAIYVVMATIAGCGYGLAYHKTQSLETAMFTHFMLNLGHILFFSYPALQ